MGVLVHTLETSTVGRGGGGGGVGSVGGKQKCLGEANLSV